MILITFVILTVFLIVYKIIKAHRYWTERHVPQGSLLFTFGEYLEIFIKTDDIFTRFRKTYQKFNGKRYYGFYLLGTPTLMLRDPDLIKEMLVKNFDHFPNHSMALADHEELWNKGLMALKDQEWHEMRSTLSPVFTTSKIKRMSVLMDEIARQFCDFFIKQDQPLITIEMKDNFTRLTNDVIASTAFGIQCNSLEERNNEFYQMGLKATKMTALRAFFLFLLLSCPKILQLFKIRIFAKEIGDFFKKIITANVEERERKGIVRPDLINIFMEANKGNLKYEEGDEVDHGEHKNHIKTEFTITDMTSQALLFFFAGFESISTILCFASYELALNPDIQERLRNEIDQIASSCDQKPNYDAINKMKYLEMIISETLRKWPGNLGMDRKCSKKYTIEPVNPDEEAVMVEEGTNVWFSINGLHRDPEYFPDPDRFDPERFNDENRPNIKPYSYVPFGVGPRHCIGSRFAMIELKIILFHILLNFEIVAVEKTEIPLQIDKKSFAMTAANGFWLGLKRRNK